MAFVIRRTDFIIFGEGTLLFDFKGLSAYRHYFVGLAYVHNLMNGRRSTRKWSPESLVDDD